MTPQRTPHRLDPESPAVLQLLELSEQYTTALYPTENIRLESAQELKDPAVCFLGIRSGTLVIACGAVRIQHDDGEYGEIKRVFVREAHRGQGYSKLIVQHLEQYLCDAGVGLARLITGPKQTAALHLYSSLGYYLRGPFGRYAANPSAVFMEKSIGMLESGPSVRSIGSM